MLTELTLSYTHTDDPTDDFGWLSASAMGEGVSRTTGCWVQWQDLVEWADQLCTDPMPPDGITVDWGFSEHGTWYSVLHVGLLQGDPSTKATVRISLRDYDDPAQQTELTFETSSAAIGQFRSDLACMMARECDQACLRAD